jgi:hypothetical protein
VVGAGASGVKDLVAGAEVLGHGPADGAGGADEQDLFHVQLRGQQAIAMTALF